MTLRDLLADLPVAAEDQRPYERDFFEHWIDADGDGCDTRQEVLLTESQAEATVGTGCAVVEGIWWSYLDNQEWTDPSRIDIDHTVALAEAWESGAWQWTAEQRRSYANDLAYDGSLMGVTDTVNSAKGALDPAEWLPPAADSTCDYISFWVSVKYRWSLTIDPVEQSALTSSTSGACGDTVVEAPSVVEVPPVVEVPSVADVSVGVLSDLGAGQELTAGQSVTSPNGSYSLIVQSDGNVVVYGPDGRAAWHTGTAGRSGARLVMQGDGNLVVYSTSGQALWNAGTNGNPGARVVMQDDGNLVVYRANGTAAWASSQSATRDRLAAGQQLVAGERLTSPNGSYRLIQQTDGNTVIYGPSGAMWATAVYGTVLRMQNDGNLVVYDRDGQPAWQAGTSGNPGATVVMQDDGNLVVYRSNGSPAYASKASTSPRPVVTSTLGSGENLGERLVSNNGSYRLVRQDDGNFVIFGPYGAAIWATGTLVGPTVLRMQGDGNLVVYASGGRPVWQSGTSGNSGARVVMQDDGNLVVYRTNGSAAWASRTATPPRSGITATQSSRTDPEFGTCAAAKSAGYGPYYRGIDPEYAWYRDADSDGIVCE